MRCLRSASMSDWIDMGFSRGECGIEVPVRSSMVLKTPIFSPRLLFPKKRKRLVLQGRHGIFCCARGSVALVASYALEIQSGSHRIVLAHERFETFHAHRTGKIEALIGVTFNAG